MVGEISVSVIVPAFNEEKSLFILYSEIKKSLTNLNCGYEIIFVDDGSTDKTRKILKEISSKDKKVKSISLKINSGKTIAQEIGIKLSKSEVIITMDGDFQHDPEDIPKFLNKMSEGYDVIVGWRQARNDSFPRIFFSKIVNFLVLLLTGFRAHDFYCGFKAYRREVVEKIKPHGDLFRFITLLAEKKGFRTAEVPIACRSRRFGRSKYGLKLFKRAFYDLLIIVYFFKNLKIPLLEKLVENRIKYRQVKLVE